MNEITTGIALGMAIIYVGMPLIKALGRAIEKSVQNRRFATKELDYIDLYA